MGCLVAAHLSAAGEEVWLLDYRRERAEHLHTQGIRVVRLTGEEERFRVRSTSRAADIGACDLTLMMVKAYHTGAAAKSLPTLMGESGVALTLQNGIGNLEEMATGVGPERLLGGVMLHGVTSLGWGQVRHAGVGHVIVGIPPGSLVSPRRRDDIAARFTAAGLECRTAEDIAAVLWDKLLLNVGINPVTALTRRPNGHLLTTPGAWEVAAAAVQEAHAVARAGQVAVSPDPLERLRQVCQATAANRSSMLQDVLAGRPTEIDAINGQIVSRGRSRGFPTPVNTVLTHLVRALTTPGEKAGGTGGAAPEETGVSENTRRRR